MKGLKFEAREVSPEAKEKLKKYMESYYKRLEMYKDLTTI